MQSICCHSNTCRRGVVSLTGGNKIKCVAFAQNLGKTNKQKNQHGTRAKTWEAVSQSSLEHLGSLRITSSSCKNRRTYFYTGPSRILRKYPDKPPLTGNEQLASGMPQRCRSFLIFHLEQLWKTADFQTLTRLAKLMGFKLFISILTWKQVAISQWCSSLSNFSVALFSCKIGFCLPEEAVHLTCFRKLFAGAMYSGLAVQGSSLLLIWQGSVLCALKYLCMFQKGFQQS